jgi:8-oxo-dGTP diphosphatase
LAGNEAFSGHLADCIVLGQDGQLVLQQRPSGWGRWGGYLNTFGGHVEPGETVMQALVRELKEELGAEVNPADVVFLGAITEEWTQHKELVHIHFWHDRHGTITGCYEGAAVRCQDVAVALSRSKVMEHLAWGLAEAKARGLAP